MPLLKARSYVLRMDPDRALPLESELFTCQHCGCARELAKRAVCRKCMALVCTDKPCVHTCTPRKAIYA